MVYTTRQNGDYGDGANGIAIPTLPHVHSHQCGASTLKCTLGLKNSLATLHGGMNFLAGHSGCLQRPGWGLPEYGTADGG